MITEHPTHSIFDSSKLDTWYDCPRQFFYRYVLGWTVDRPAHDLYFGNAWHIAREYQLLHGYEDVSGAYTAFINFYRKEFPQETDEIYCPKDPTGVAMALTKFADERRSDLRDNEVLFTETSGTVPITQDGKVLHYRMDSVVRNRSTGKIFSWDHKSAKSFGRTWEDKFYLSVQAGTYTHCLYCLYPIEEVIGIEFCGTAFQYLKRGSKTSSQGYRIEFCRVPAWKTPDQMNVWLWNTVTQVNNIEREMDKLSHCSHNDSVMQCFPLNPNSCTKYWGCAYHDYCLSWSNPLRSCDEPPLGFRTEWWNPSDMQTTNKKDLQWR
jgi:hypothetical protein